MPVSARTSTTARKRTTAPTAKKTPASSKAKKASASPKVKATRESDGSNSLARLLGVLDLFTPAAPAWPTNALIKSLGMSRSTGYRYIKALADVRLLTPVSNGHYVLGPRIIELDRQIRQCDPLYNAAGPAMRWLYSKSGYSVTLCALFSGAVLCVREELTADSPSNLFTRGQTRPLFRGATSKIILPYLRPHQLRILYTKHSKEIATSGLGTDWASFRANLAKIRRAGSVVTVGEFNPGVLGIAAPVFNRAGHILGSIGIAGTESQFTPQEIERVTELVLAAGKKVNERVAVTNVGTDLAARAIR